MPHLDAKDSPAGRRLKRLGKALVAVAVLLVAVALAAKWWIVPAVIRSQLRAAAADYWDGEVTLGSVDFNYFGPIGLGGLRVIDPAGREWLRVGKVTAWLRDWPGVHPYLTGVAVDHATVALHFKGGRCEPPLKTPPPAEPGRAGEYVDLASLRITKLTVELVDHDTGRRCRYEATGQARRSGMGPTAYDVLAICERPLGLSIMGLVDANSLAANLTARCTWRPTREEFAFASSLLGIRDIAAAGGAIDAHLAVTGRLDAPTGLHARGYVQVTDLRAAAADANVLDDLDARIELDGGTGTLSHCRAAVPAAALTIAASPFTYDLAKGTLSADVRGIVVEATGGPGGAFWQRLLGGAAVRGKVTATGRVTLDAARPQPVDFDFDVTPDVAEVTFPKHPQRNLKNVTAGALRVRPTEIITKDLSAEAASGRVKLSGKAQLLARAGTGRPPAPADWANIEQVAADGHLFMDNVDLVAVPVLPELLGVMKVLPTGQKSVSDVHALFSLRGGVVTIEEGRLANPISALAVQKDGKIDLRNKHLDLHVTVVGIKQLHAVLKAIPLLSLAVDFKDKLARFRVHGPWDDPPAKLVQPEPIGSIAKSTEEFFKGVVKTGGQLGGGIVRGLGGLLKALDNGLRKGPANKGDGK